MLVNVGVQGDIEVKIPTDLKLDPTDIEERGILRDPDVGDIRSRVGILLSIYFLEGWSQSKRRALLDILANYLQFFGDKVTHYQTFDNRRLLRRELGRTNLPEDYLDMIPDTDVFYYKMQQVNPKETDDPDLYRIICFGFPNDHPKRPLSGIKVHFPPSFVFSEPDRFTDLIAKWSDWLGAAHGSCGLGALSVPGGETTSKAYWYPWLMQYPALEYDNMGGYFSESSDGGYERPRSSNWLTILGRDNVASLGGLAAIGDQLTPEMYAVPFSTGVVIRASYLPALGDANSGGIPNGYRVAAHMIKTIRFEGYRWGVIKEPVPVKGPEVSLEWVRRFD